MRPFGHTESREERESSLVDPLADAWKSYLLFADRDKPLIDHFDYAMASFTFRPSMWQLERHILAHHDGPDSDFLGLFVSAGYQLLPEREIHYALDTPALNDFGSFLMGKHLIIDGRVGRDAGWWMTGSLTINGSIGPSAGYKMIGSLTINVEKTIDMGKYMIGTLTKVDRDVVAGFYMIGSRDGDWVYRAHKWNPRQHTRERFLEDITNPDDLSYNALQAAIMRRYRKKNQGWIL